MQQMIENKTIKIKVMAYLRFVFVVFFLVAGFTSHAQTIEKLKIKVERTGDGIYEFTAVNPNYFPMQLELTFTNFENMSADCELPYTGTIMPGTHKIFTLSRVFVDIPGGFDYKYNTRIGAYPVTHDNKAIYKLPVVEGEKVKAVGFDLTNSRTPDKILWGFEMDYDQTVYACRQGVVCQMTKVQMRNDMKVGDNTLTILHPDNTFGRYELLADESFLVQIGDTVSAGDPIAQVGKSRLSTSPQIRFSVYYVNTRIDTINAAKVRDIHAYVNPVFKSAGKKTFILEDGVEYKN